MANLFSVQAQENWRHGRVLASTTFAGTASLHRGVDLSADLVAKLDALLDPNVARGIKLSLGAGVDLRAVLALQAAVPLDLFAARAGVVARLQAAAELAAWIRAQLELDATVFGVEMFAGMSAEWAPFIRIFLEEVAISAGLFAKVSLSAEAAAQAVLAGALIPEEPDGTAGVTLAMDFAAAVEVGGGLSLITELGFPNPQRLLGRLGDELSIRLIRASDAALSGPDAEDGARFLRIAVPVAVRTAVELGFQLARNLSTNEAKANVARTFLRQAQIELLHMLMQVVVRFFASDATSRAGQLGPQSPETLLELATRMEDAVAALGAFLLRPKTADDTWLDGALALLGPLSDVALGIVPEDARSVWTERLADLWAAVTLTHRVLARSSADDPDFGSQTAGVPPSAASIQHYINSRLGRPVDSGLTEGDAVAFLLLSDWETSLARAFPRIATLLDWMRQALGDNRTVVAALLQPQGFGNTGDAAAKLATVAAALEKVIEPQIVTRVLVPLQTQLPELAPIIKEVALPTIRMLAAVVVPRLATLSSGDAEAAQTLREQLSGVLLQFLTRLIVAALRLVAHHGFEDSRTYLSQLSGAVRRGEANDAVAHVIIQATRGSVVPLLTPDSEDIAQLLELIAGTCSSADAAVDPTCDALQAVLTLGLATGFGQIDALRNADALPDQQSLRRLVDDVVQADAALLSGIFAGASNLIASSLHRHAVAWGATLIDSVHAVVSEVQRAVSTLGNIDADIDTAQGIVNGALGQIDKAVKAIADQIGLAANEVLATLHDRGWDVARAALYAALPPKLAQFSEGALRAAYDNAFDATKRAVATYLHSLTSLADAFRSELSAEVAAGAVSARALVDGVRRRVAGASAPELAFDVSVAGVATVHVAVPGSEVLAAAMANIFGRAAVGAAVSTLESQGRIQVSGQASVDVLKAIKANFITQNAALLAARNMIQTGGTLRTHVSGVIDGNLYDSGSLTVTIQVSGANTSYLTSILSAPPRVRILLNGHDVPYNADQWAGGGAARPLELALTITASPRGNSASGSTLRAVPDVDPGWPPRRPLVDFPDLASSAAPLLALGRVGKNVLQVIAVHGADGESPKQPEQHVFFLAAPAQDVEPMSPAALVNMVSLLLSD